jgi:hypothetical protein
MKLKLHWQERYEVVREFPSFELCTEEYPELELEIMDVYNARTAEEQARALGDLEYKMHQTESGERGETIFEMVEPYSFDLYQDAQVYPITEEIGSLVVTKEEEEE